MILVSDRRGVGQTFSPRDKMEWGDHCFIESLLTNYPLEGFDLVVPRGVIGRESSNENFFFTKKTGGKGPPSIYAK